MRALLPILALVCSCLGAGPEHTEATQEADRELLRHLKEVEWSAAYREQDTVLLDRILHDDFQMIDAAGNTFTKADELDWIKDNEWKVDSLRYEITRLETWPNGTAMVSGSGHMLRDSTETVYWSSNVFIKSDGFGGRYRRTSPE